MTSSFQSHFGLILSVHVSEVFSIDEALSFNPILVWFYQRSCSRARPTIPRFQSHFGLILSHVWELHVESVHYCFQSHFGLILSVEDTVADEVVQVAFNPILVWFYLVFVTILNGHGTNIFQSHFGLILSLIDNADKVDGHDAFQSHFGLILSVSLPTSSDWNSNRFQSHFGLILSSQSETS